MPAASPPQHLICIWHWKRNLKKHVLAKVGTQPDRDKTWRDVMAVINEIDPAKLKIKFAALVAQLSSNPSTAKFSKYLNTYTPRLSEMAVAYRQGSLSNTNMISEAFHKLLKYCELGRRSGNRCDRVVQVLLDRANIRRLDFIRSKVIRPDSHRLNQMRTDCRASQPLTFNRVHMMTGGMGFTVPSSSDPAKLYVVSIIMARYAECQLYPSCPFFCAPCGFCCHQTSCNCPMMTIRQQISCKHVHLLARYCEHSVNQPLVDRAALKQAKLIPPQQPLTPPPPSPLPANPPLPNIPSHPLALGPAFLAADNLMKKMQGFKHSQGPEMEALAKQIDDVTSQLASVGHLARGGNVLGAPKNHHRALFQQQNRKGAKSGGGPQNSPIKSPNAPGPSRKRSNSSTPKKKGAPPNKMGGGGAG